MRTNSVQKWGVGCRLAGTYILEGKERGEEEREGSSQGRAFPDLSLPLSVIDHGLDAYLLVMGEETGHGSWVTGVARH